MSWRRWVVAASLLVVTALFVIDHVPRFMVGDSESYLSAMISLPPDRSWIYGLAVSVLARATGGLLSYIVLQLIALTVFVYAAIRVFPAGRRPRLCACVFAIGIACDPLIEFYARSYMSDFSAALLFGGFVCLVAALVHKRQGWSLRLRLAGWAAAAALGAGAVLFRVAYAPIEVATLLLGVVAHWRRSEAGARLRLAAACLVPVLAVAGLIAANSVVFAARFADPAFTNRLSGLFLAGVFSPALTASDMRRAGIDVTDDEVARMGLGDYGNRVRQVWGVEPFWLRHVLERKLQTDDVYDRRLNAVAHAMVMAALRRDPLSLAVVYLKGLWLYCEPGQWADHVDAEMGVHRGFDAWFVDVINAQVHGKLTVSSGRVTSPLVRVLPVVVGAYPFLLFAGVLASVAILAGRGAARQRLPAAALLAGIAVAPLYSNFVIPRYVLCSVLFAWLLIPQAALEVARSSTTSRIVPMSLRRSASAWIASSRRSSH